MTAGSKDEDAVSHASAGGVGAVVLKVTGAAEADRAARELDHDAAAS